MAKKLVSIALVIIALQLVNHANVNAQGNVYKLHSLFIYNFTKHVQWSEVGDTFTIGVYGSQNALKEVQANFSGKSFSGKEIRVINIASVGDANASQLVYMPKSNKNKILNIFEDANKSNTLFVSEDDLIEHGFPISFIIEGAQLGFKVSRNNLKASGLKISTSLLSLAKVVD